MADLQKRTNENSVIVKPSQPASDSAVTLGLWLDRMGLLFNQDMLTEVVDLWGRVLRGYHPGAIDYGFEQYLRYGEPFMPKPSEIVRYAEMWNPDDIPQQGQSEYGCATCNWTGFAPTGEGTRVKHCECRRDPSLRTPKPEVPQMDLGDVRDQLMEQLNQGIASPDTAKLVVGPKPIAPPAPAEVQEQFVRDAIARHQEK